MDAEDDLAYVDDEMDEDFVPPNKRRSPRGSLKPSSLVSLKRSEDNSTPKPATGKYVQGEGFKFDSFGVFVQETVKQ